MYINTHIYVYTLLLPKTHKCKFISPISLLRSSHSIFLFLFGGRMSSIYGIFYYVSYINHIYKASSVNSIFYLFKLKQKFIDIMNQGLPVSSSAHKERGSPYGSTKLNTLENQQLSSDPPEKWSHRTDRCPKIGETDRNLEHLDLPEQKIWIDIRAEFQILLSCPKILQFLSILIQHTPLFLQLFPFLKHSM